MLQTDGVCHRETGPTLDTEKVGNTLDDLMEMVSDMLPVNGQVYPHLAENPVDELAFCLRHSALHFSKTAGRLAAFVEDADHGKYSRIEVLQAIIAASLVNSLKLADEIGISGSEIVLEIRRKYDLPELEALRKLS